MLKIVIHKLVVSLFINLIITQLDLNNISISRQTVYLNSLPITLLYC